ncbi:MAG TPA: peptide chain release factor N(5)-glutamine methyltransferase [Candidatus Saccharimonadales bacterium]|nr:peptide chain release factor N(5)-glutamine methyltransferase [Candidatus Saccharimonadales bacterium]
MQIEKWLVQNILTLQDAGIGTARLDALVLLEDLLDTDRAQLLAHPEHELTDAQTAILQEQIKRRARHVPLAYIRGKTEFYGRTFAVNDHVLEPRPETEMMIDLYKYLPGHDRMRVADIGTGSGALAITVKLDMPDTTLYGIDIDQHCLDLARHNADRLKADITLVKGDFAAPLADLETPVDTLLCNLPYVPDNFQINTAATHEPRLAIFGGPDGLDTYRTLFGQLQGLQKSPRYVLTESLPPQHGELAEIAAAHGYGIQKREDFIQVFALRAAA